MCYSHAARMQVYYALETKTSAAGPLLLDIVSLTPLSTPVYIEVCDVATQKLLSVYIGTGAIL
mgnify:CR=1 FL=1